MSIELKQAAQQAIEAIQDLRGYRPDIDKAIEALRAALSQQPDNTACRSVQKRIAAQQPATAIACGIPGMAKTTCPYCEQGFAFEFKQEEAKPEPVGYENEMGELIKFPQPCIWMGADCPRKKAIANTPDCYELLYTHPAPSVPDAAIDSAIYNQCPDFDNWHEGPSIDDIKAIVRAAMLHNP